MVLAAAGHPEQERIESRGQRGGIRLDRRGQRSALTLT